MYVHVCMYVCMCVCMCMCNGGNYGCLATSDPHLALEGFRPTMDSVYYK